jgi:hypothetical protein
MALPFYRRDLNLKPIELPARRGSNHKSASPVNTTEKSMPGGSEDSTKGTGTVITENHDIPPDS